MMEAGKSKKRTLIADILHYPIWLTPLEKQVLGTTIFNRLHNVNQNSTAYLTFPSIGHSRFSHSLGAMALTGQLFYHGVINANREHLETFLKAAEKLSKEVRKPFKQRYYSNLKEHCDPSDPSNYNADFEEFSSLDTVIPHFLSDEEKYWFSAIIQALRLAALVHDLGHPPFSHVTENALDDVKREIGRHLETNRLNEKQEQFLACLEPAGEELNPVQPHEALTRILFDELADGVLLNMSVVKKPDKQFCFVWLSLRIAGHILSNGSALDPGKKEEIEVLRCLHLLTAGDLDGDRLDYIQRDAILAGIKDSGLRADRLIQLMQLTYVENGADMVPRVIPNIRSLRSLEDYFSARFELYRSVMFHHHVVKTDGLFQAIVRDLAIEWLNDDGESDPESVAQSTLLLTEDNSYIAWLWLIFDEKIFENEAQPRRDRVYLQWDDNWLLSFLRIMFVKLHMDENRFEDENKEKLYCRLEELVASKRNYLSLVKRYEEFREIEIAFFKELKQTYELEPDFINQTALPFKEESGSSASSGKKAEEEDGFLTIKLASLLAEFVDRLRCQSSCQDTVMKEASERSLYYAEAILALMRNPIYEGFEADYCNNVGTKDVLLIQKRISTGFNEDFLVQTDNGPQPFVNYSLLAGELTRKSERWPMFFAYVLTPNENDPHKLRKELGKSLARNFINKLKGSLL